MLVDAIAQTASWSWWRHQLEKISVLLAFCAGNSPVPVNSPHKGQWRGALVFSLICAWTNRWVNTREAGDLKCDQAHYDISVMMILFSSITFHDVAKKWYREIETKYVFLKRTKYSKI